MFSREDKGLVAEWWRTIDRELLAALLMLLVAGMVLSFAASPPVAERLGLSPWHFIIRHAFFVVAAVAVLVATSLLSQRWARVFGLAMLAGGLVLLWATPWIGDEIKGARRWISFAGQSLQPAEFVKPGFAVIGAWLFAEKLVHKDMPARLFAFVLTGAIVVPLLLQPDIGQTALVIATFSVMLFIAGISWWVIFGLMGVAGGALFAAYMFFPHVARRIDTFINPDSGGDTYQIDRAIQSLLEGGWFGRGPGESIAKKLIPDAHADYVFSAAAGEFGLIFCMMLVALIAFIAIRALVSAQNQPSLFPRMAASVLAIQFGMQSGINLAVNLNLVPAKGMTLPFVSYGGTSMLAIAFAMGLMLALTRTKPEDRIATGLPAYRSAMVPAQ